MDEVLAQLGLAGAIIGAAVYLQRTQHAGLARLVALTRPTTVTLRLDPEQLEEVLQTRRELSEQSERIDQIEDRLTSLSRSDLKRTGTEG